MMENPVPAGAAAPAVPIAASGHYSRHYGAPGTGAGASGTLPSSLRRPPAAKSQRFARHQSGGGGQYSSREYLFYPQVRRIEYLGPCFVLVPSVKSVTCRDNLSISNWSIDSQLLTKDFGITHTEESECQTRAARKCVGEISRHHHRRRHVIDLI